MPIFEGTIYNQEVNIDTVQYTENFINSTMNASQNGQPNTNYILSIGIKLHDTQWTHLCIGVPVYVYNIKRFKYDGGFILSLPNSPYKSDFVNHTNYRHLLKYGTVTLSWNTLTSNFNLKPTYYDHASDNTKFQFNERGRSPIKQKFITRSSHQHSHWMLGVHCPLFFVWPRILSKHVLWSTRLSRI